MNPGPRPIRRSLKTSVRVLGDRVHEFEALCHLLRRRPHELAADLVLDGINRHMEDPKTRDAVVALVAARVGQRALEELQAQSRPKRGGFRVFDGGQP